MKRFLLTTLLICFIGINNLVALNYSYTIIIVAAVDEIIAFEATDNGYQVVSNVADADYGFYDGQGNETDAYNASVFNIVAS